MYEFKLPDLGEGIHEAEILQWYVSVGDKIKEDANLVNLETDKAAVTIPAPKGGVISGLFAKAGDTVSVGQILVTIDTGEALVKEKPESVVSEDVGSEDVGSPGNGKAKPPAPPSSSMVKQPSSSGTKDHPGPVPAAPATRRLAREMKVDIKLVTPTGPAGRVTADDVRKFAEGGSNARVSVANNAAVTSSVFLSSLDGRIDDRSHKNAINQPPTVDSLTEFAAHAASTIPFLDIQPLPDFEKFGPVEVEPLRSIRRKVARKMVTSMVLVPHVAHMDEADVTELEEFRKREQGRRKGQPGGHLTLLSFVTRAVVAGLKAAPSFNASLDPFKEELIYKKYYNIGIAVDSGKGLIVPVIKDADKKSIIEISKTIEKLATIAREGKITVEDLQGGTFTITNVGPLGGTAMIPTINYPEVAILGMGKVQEKPVVRDGQIVIRKILPITLAFDHRVADGIDAARFVSELIRLLSDPSLLMLET
jgi:pyruvate dehydrogenase E2 component (dihydrolipoamide acetyltransferase)